jgi:hypothetical protein
MRIFFELYAAQLGFAVYSVALGHSLRNDILWHSRRDEAQEPENTNQAAQPSANSSSRPPAKPFAHNGNFHRTAMAKLVARLLTDHRRNSSLRSPRKQRQTFFIEGGGVRRRSTLYQIVGIRDLSSLVRKRLLDFLVWHGPRDSLLRGICVLSRASRRAPASVD